MKKELLKKNFMSLALIVGLTVMVSVFAGDVVFKEGEGLDVADNLTVNGRVGIGVSNPGEALVLDDSVTNDVGMQFGLENYGTKIIGWSQGNSSWNDLEIRVTSGVGSGIYLETDGDIGIGTYNPSYPLEVRGDTGAVSIWAEKNISATGFITRTHVFDKSKGSALDLIKDADDLKSGLEIYHSKFYGYAGEFEVTDYSRPEVKEECDIEGCRDVTTYPYTKIEEGVMLDMEVELLRQAVFELKGRLDEVCVKDYSYTWC